MLAAIEVGVAVAVGEWIGYPAMLIALVAVSFVGLWFVKAQGLSAFTRVGADLARARPPGRRLVDGLLVGVAGLLLLVPGFVTDLAAVVLLVPVTRRLVRNALVVRWSRRLTGRGRTVLRALPRV